MNFEDFKRKVSLGGTVPLSTEEWKEFAHHFPVEERHQTQLAGELLIVRFGGEFLAIETPSKGARVARILSDLQEARAFVARRMEEYERMWDGCGVKVDYYEDRKSQEAEG